MKDHGRYSPGYSLVEMMVAMAIVVVAIAAAAGGWIFTVRGERLNAIQSELDMDVRKAMEQLKADLRLSSIDKVFFYPAGVGPYTAISFPLARDDDGDGAVELGPGGTNIIWDSTVIYHVWTGMPNKLLKTVFSPRDNTLTDAQRQEQLDYVAVLGSGSGTHNGAHASTITIFENLFSWSIFGKGAVYDAYSPTFKRDVSVAFGSVMLTDGTHTFKFTVTGRNASSSGCRIGIDSLVVSPCGVEREGEAQLPPATQSGASACVEYMAGGSWGGNNQLLFPASATGSYFTLAMENDRWEETNFRGQGALCRRTMVDFDENMSPKDFVVRLEGPGYAWQAEVQSGATNADSGSDDFLTNCVVRLLLRGETMAQGGAIRFSGKTQYVLFVASDQAPLRIQGAFIAEAANMTDYTPNAAASGTRLFFYNSPYGPYNLPQVTVPAGGSWWACTQTPYEIDSTKSYLISFLVGTNGNAKNWVETHPGAPGVYLIPASANPTLTDAQDADWSAKTVIQDGRLFGVSGVYTTYPTNGTFTSQIFDTKMSAPAYSTISWSADQPFGTSLKMKVRTGNAEDLSDASAWSNVTAMTSPGTINPGNKRYVQFRAILDPDASSWSTPKLKDVTIRWPGASKVVDIGATMTKGPNYGICELTVDGKTLSKGIRVDLSIYEDVLGWAQRGKWLTSSMTAEIEPRNTGK